VAIPMVVIGVTTGTPVYLTGNIGFSGDACTLQTVINVLRFQYGKGTFRSHVALAWRQRNADQR
jgi:hypothetical protein